MGQKIGVLSQKMPHSASFIKAHNDGFISWFEEIEACFAYLLHESLDRLFIDEELLSDTKSCLGKYQKQLEQLHPRMEIAHVPISDLSKTHSSFIKHFPQLEILFKNGDLKSVFQPIVQDDGPGIKLYGFECLTRFCCNGSNFPPEFVFNYAQEKLKLITSDKICLMQALSLIPHKDTLIFVNVRPQTLISFDFYPWFKSLLKKHQLEPEQMVIEVTEQYCNISEQDLADQCHILQSSGFHMAIDDFGAGISNLTMLEVMKPRYIKISGRFTKNADTNPSKQKIITNVLSLANDFGINAIVESIETLSEWETVKALGARLGQGFYFYRPMATQEAKALFTDKTHIKKLETAIYE